MSMEKAFAVLTIFTWLAVGSLLFALVYAAFFGQLDTRGLLIDKKTGLFSTARLQLVGTTVVIAIIYLQKVATSPPACELPGPCILPGFDDTLVAALSGGIYGVAKLNSTLRAGPAGLSLLQTIAESQRRIR